MKLEPLPLPPSRQADPLDNPIVQRDAARDLAQVLADRNDRALALHITFPGLGGRCACCREMFPCRTVRALNGDDEDETK